MSRHFLPLVINQAYSTHTFGLREGASECSSPYVRLAIRWRSIKNWKLAFVSTNHRLAILVILNEIRVTRVFSSSSSAVIAHNCASYSQQGSHPRSLRKTSRAICPWFHTSESFFGPPFKAFNWRSGAGSPGLSILYAYQRILATEIIRHITLS